MKNLIPFISRVGFLLSITIAFITKDLVLSIICAVILYVVCVTLEAVLQKTVLKQSPEIVKVFSMMKRMDLKGKIENILALVIPLLIQVLSVILVWLVLR
ncbi:MAG: hypothetical protein IJF54_06775 [Clostridia bacterium]|nr:hypothetical protein [Clostridia bacterium]